MSDIIPIEELYGGRDSDSLSMCLKEVINSCLVEGLENKLKNVPITSKDDGIMKELYNKRTKVIETLHQAGYLAVVSNDIENEYSGKNTGWRLNDRGLEPVPDKLKTQGKPLHWRGDISYSNYKLWVILPDTLEP